MTLLTSSYINNFDEKSYKVMKKIINYTINEG